MRSEWIRNQDSCKPAVFHDWYQRTNPKVSLSTYYWSWTPSRLANPSYGEPTCRPKSGERSESNQPLYPTRKKTIPHSTIFPKSMETTTWCIEKVRRENMLLNSATNPTHTPTPTSPASFNATPTWGGHGFSPSRRYSSPSSSPLSRHNNPVQSCCCCPPPHPPPRLQTAFWTRLPPRFSHTTLVLQWTRHIYEVYVLVHDCISYYVRQGWDFEHPIFLSVPTSVLHSVNGMIAVISSSSSCFLLVTDHCRFLDILFPFCYLVPDIIFPWERRRWGSNY